MFHKELSMLECLFSCGDIKERKKERARKGGLLS